MDQQWPQYGAESPSSRQARYAPHAQGQPPQTPREANHLPSMKTDQYITSAVPSRAQSMNLTSPSAPQSRGPYDGDGDGDVQMEDADPYNKAKHGGRPGHSRMNSAQMIQQEESSAARRYSPMNLSPSSPYAATPQQQQQAQFAAFGAQLNSNNHSPTRVGYPAGPNQHGYYSPPGKHVDLYARDLTGLITCQRHDLTHLNSHLFNRPSVLRPIILNRPLLQWRASMAAPPNQSRRGTRRRSPNRRHWRSEGRYLSLRNAHAYQSCSTE